MPTTAACFQRKLVIAAPLVCVLTISPSAALADNPIVQTNYTADPAPMVYDGRVYLYTGHDEDSATSWYTMNEWRVYSSADMVNWTDHGSPMSYHTFSWAKGDAWAAQPVHKNGKFYYYAPMTSSSTNSMAIGVGVSDSPTGPFHDAIGKPLISGGSCENIDPTPFIDDSGQGYLYWGRTEPCYVKLNDDMVSYQGSIVRIATNAASFGPSAGSSWPSMYEEGPWYFKRNGLYYLAYAAGGIPESIAYSMSTGPTGPWSYKGVIMAPQGASFTNQTGVIDFNGTSYFFYHDGALPGGGGFHRSVCVERFTYNADGTFPTIKMTAAGPPGIGHLDPYARTEAETIAWESGVRTEVCSEGGMDVTSIHDGDYIKVRGVDFRTGAVSFDARVATNTSGGNIELHLDDPAGTLVGTCAVTTTGGAQTWVTQSCPVSGASGIHDLYLKFTGGTDSLFNFDWWRFNAPADAGAGGSAGGAGGNVGGDAAAGSGGSSAGTGGSGFAGRAGGAAGNDGVAGDARGCACRSASGRSDSAPALLLLVLAAFGRRRRTTGARGRRLLRIGSTALLLATSACSSKGANSVTGSGGSSASGGSGVAGRVNAPDAGVGGDGSSGAAGAAIASRQAYDGARGRSFNDAWRFYRGDATHAAEASFDDTAWRSLNVPHDFSIELPFNQSSASGSGGGYLDGGVGWYRKAFTLDASDSGQRILIEFDGAYMNSEVWINGTSLGTRPYGYSTFQYDLTPYVKMGGENVLAIRVDNHQPTSRWYSGSGIERNVWLTVLNPIHIAYGGVFVTTPSVSAASGTVSIVTDVQNQSNTSQSVTITTGIYDAGGTLVTSSTTAVNDVAANATSTSSQSLSVSNPKLWSPDAPNLYQVKVQLQVGGATVDTYVSPLGFRWFSFSSTSGFTLNDKPMKLRGTCNHHDLGALGAAFNYRALERELQILKAMGVNALRTSHNPPAPELLEMADRLGFMVMDEAFDCWESGKNANDYHVYFSQWAKTDLQDFVRRDRNHPSVIMWSIGNEIPNPTVATATNLRNWVRELDSTRPVTWNLMDVGNATAQEVASVLDLQGYSYNSWQYDAGHSAHPNWKMFGSESSSAVRSRGVYHTPPSQNILMSADTQCSSYDNSVVVWGASAENSYRDDVSRSYIAGQFIWTGFDYIGEPTPYGWPAKSSYFGIVDTAGFPKDIYYFYQSRWTTAPMVHILPHWNWTTGTTVAVWAYSNCDSVELFLNGVSQGNKTFSPDTLHVEWNIPWASGTLRAEGKRAGSVVVSDEVKTAAVPAKIELSVDRTKIQADGHDLAFVTAVIQDDKGVSVPAADNAVTFTISGPGRITATDNGNPIDATSYASTTRNAFSGKALAIVQSTGESGPITVTATASGLTSGSVSTNAM